MARIGLALMLLAFTVQWWMPLFSGGVTREPIDYQMPVEGLQGNQIMLDGPDIAEVSHPSTCSTDVTDFVSCDNSDSITVDYANVIYADGEYVYGTH